VKEVQALFFDLDATLVFLDRDVLEQKMGFVCSAIATAHEGLNPAELQTQHQLITVELWHLAESGALDGRSVMRETWRRALSLCGCELEAVAATAFDLFWANRLGIVRLFDDVTDALRQVKGHVQTAVITNGPEDTQLDKLQVVGLENYFDLFVASGEVKACKPDEAIFRFALDRLGLDPQHVWHVGDSLTNDVAGAQGLGITAVWLNRNVGVRKDTDPQPDYEISSLMELPPLLSDKWSQ
jgi:HAD superfamily hydrolase (TIGR01493 family)